MSTVEAERRTIPGNQVCESGKITLRQFVRTDGGDLGRPFANFINQSFQLAPRWGSEATWLSTWPARVVIFTITIFLANRGKYDDAEPLFKRALAIREETLGPRHPDVAGSLNNLAGLLDSQVMWY